MAGSQWVFVWVLVCDDGGLRVMVFFFGCYFEGGVVLFCGLIGGGLVGCCWLVHGGFGWFGVVGGWGGVLLGGGGGVLFGCWVVLLVGYGIWYFFFFWVVL